jgi:hypothetical protein
MVAAGALVVLATPSDAQTVSTADARVNGSHEEKSRAFDVASLPLGTPVELEVIFEVAG